MTPEEWERYKLLTGTAEEGGEMEAWQGLVIEEKAELDGKVDRLVLALKGFDMTAEERERLERQLAAMTQYSGILAERIAAFKTSTAT